MISTSRVNFKNARILVIEDSPDHRAIIDNAVKHCLPEVKTTLIASEEEALAYFDTCRLEEWEVPKLILLDLYLPDRENGWRLLEQIKAIPTALGKVPVVLLSCSTNSADIAEAYDRGCSSYIIKPGNFDNWLEYFRTLRSYWWETVTLPKAGVSLF